MVKETLMLLCYYYAIAAFSFLEIHVILSVAAARRIKTSAVGISILMCNSKLEGELVAGPHGREEET